MLPPVVAWEWAEARRRQVVLTDVRWYADGRCGLEAYERGRPRTSPGNLTQHPGT